MICTGYSRVQTPIHPNDILLIERNKHCSLDLDKIVDEIRVSSTHLFHKVELHSCHTLTYKYRQIIACSWFRLFWDVDQMQVDWKSCKHPLANSFLAASFSGSSQEKICYIRTNTARRSSLTNLFALSALMAISFFVSDRLQSTKSVGFTYFCPAIVAPNLALSLSCWMVKEASRVGWSRSKRNVKRRSWHWILIIIEKWNWNNECSVKQSNDLSLFICHLWQRKCSSPQSNVRWMWARIGLTIAGEEKLEDHVNERMRHVIWRGDSVTRQVFFSSALCLSFFLSFFLSVHCNWWD